MLNHLSAPASTIQPSSHPCPTPQETRSDASSTVRDRPRLLPALRVGDGWLSLEAVGCRNNRLVYRWYVDIPAGEFSEADLSSPRDNTQEAFCALLSFLSAAAEGLRHQEAAGRQSENADLFPARVAQWAREHGDELSALREDIESGGKLIEEEG